MLKRLILIFAYLPVFMLPVLAGCGKQPKAALTIGVLPITDNLPLWVAEERGYLREAGLEVRFISFPSAVERDSAFTAGQIDLAVGDLIAVAQMRRGGTKVKAVAICQGVKPEEGRFAVLAAPGSKISEAQQLKNVPVACSLKTINEYVVDRVLAGAGLAPEEIKKVAMPKIPLRMQALLSGKVEAAVLPDPLAALAEGKGARLIIDDTRENISQTVIIVREETINENLDALVRLMAAYNRAVNDIQKNPSGWSRLLKEKARVPEEVLTGGPHGMRIVFSPAAIPDPEGVQAVTDWLVEKEVLTEPMSYGDLVDERVLGG